MDSCHEPGALHSECPACKEISRLRPRVTTLSNEIHPSQQEPDLETAYNELPNDYLLVRDNRDELLKDMAELHPVQECVSEIYRLRSALEKIERQDFHEPFAAEIARAALQTPPLPF